MLKSTKKLKSKGGVAAVGFAPTAAPSGIPSKATADTVFPPKAILPEAALALALIRAGRALLGWTGEDLARAAGLSWATVRNYERGGSPPTGKSVKRMVQALATAGVEIMPGGDRPGVRFRPGFAPPATSDALARALTPVPPAGSGVDEDDDDGDA